MAGGDKETRWLPLESNPDVMNKYLQRIGVPEVQCVDVYGLDESLLALVPSPTYALLLLFPYTAKHKDANEKQVKELEAKGYKVPANVFFMKQHIHNACGTFALMHALGNNVDKIGIKSDAWFRKFYDEAVNKTPDERSKALEENENMTVAHEISAQEGQTEAPRLEDEVLHHFICFTAKDGKLYEIDGGRPFPIDHGETTDSEFLAKAAKICKEYMDRDPEELNFTLIALAKTQD